jgi:hypothetical protein
LPLLPVGLSLLDAVIEILKETLIKKDIPSQRLLKTANFGFNHTNMLEMSRKWVA